jgi:hypothetical protein
MLKLALILTLIAKLIVTLVITKRQSQLGTNSHRAKSVPSSPISSASKDDYLIHAR